MLQAEAIQGEMWIDGSFLTHAIDPRDVDFALRIELSFLVQTTQSQQSLLRWLGTNNNQARDQIKRGYMCDSYVFCEFPQTHPLYPGTDVRQYWATQFGFDRNHNPKGIAVLSIPDGVQ